MDPDAAAAIMRDESADMEDRIEAARSLWRWLFEGGFPQVMYDENGDVRQFGGETEERRKLAHRFAAGQEVTTFIAVNGVPQP